MRRKCSKAISKLHFIDRADQATPNSYPYPFYTPDFQASLSYISGQSSDTAVNQQHAGIQSNEQVSEPVSARPKTVRFYDKVCKNALYCALLDDRLTKSLETESICAITLDSGKFWRPKDTYKRRIEVVEWLSNMASPVYGDCKALHLAIQYLDQFLCDFDQPIEAGHLKYYAFASLKLAKIAIEGTPQVVLALAEGVMGMLLSDKFNQALLQIFWILHWCLSSVDSAAGTIYEKKIDLPSMTSFLLLAFRRAAVELLERFANQQRLEWLPNEQLPAVTTLIASRPCLNACHNANTLLRSHISPLFRNSELAAACFFIATQSEDIDSTVFIKCTGHSIESLQSAIAYARAVCGAI
ncbi:hypothetical protein GGF39_002341 [Coemansia sp. RSA 1721]|nr:hypothetical protein GGF39_002341 [Coemansia sp. RSA 1721]